MVGTRIARRAEARDESSEGRGWFTRRRRVIGGVVAGAACTSACTSLRATLRRRRTGRTTLPPKGPADVRRLGPRLHARRASTTFEDATLRRGDATAPTDARRHVGPDVGRRRAPAHKPSPSDPCGLDPQCDCPSQETCDLDGGEGTICVVSGNALAGHGCTTTASCAPGLTCSNGVCRPYCTLTVDAGCNAKLAEGGACVSAVLGDDGGPLPELRRLLVPLSAPGPERLRRDGRPLRPAAFRTTMAAPTASAWGSSKLGGDCTYLQRLRSRSLVCVGQCAQWCRVGHSPSDCGGGDAGACQAFGDPITVYGVQYGYCP